MAILEGKKYGTCFSELTSQNIIPLHRLPLREKEDGVYLKLWRTVPAIEQKNEMAGRNRVRNET